MTKIGGIYGVADWLSLAATRHTYNKTYELAAKYKFANQIVDGFPVTIVGYNTMDINSELKKDALFFKISNKNICGDAVHIMKQLPDNTIDLTITSPPYDCYSDDTEVLTLNGWKLIKDVYIGEKVLTLNPNTKEVYYENVIKSFEGKPTIRKKGKPPVTQDQIFAVQAVRELSSRYPGIGTYKQFRAGTSNYI